MSANPQWPSRAKGYRAIHPTQHIAGATSNFVVPVEELARILDERIEEINREQGFDTLQLEQPNQSRAAGAVQIITANGESASHGTLKASALARRMWSIRERESRAVRVEIADALLSGAGVMIEDTELPTLPAGKVAAKEAVDIHQELTDEPLNELDAHRLERSLLHFAQGYVHDFHIIDQQICRGLELLFGGKRNGRAIVSSGQLTAV